MWKWERERDMALSGAPARSNSYMQSNSREDCTDYWKPKVPVSTQKPTPCLPRIGTSRSVSRDTQHEVPVAWRHKVIQQRPCNDDPWHCPGDIGHSRNDPCRHGNPGCHDDDGKQVKNEDGDDEQDEDEDDDESGEGGREKGRHREEREEKKKRRDGEAKHRHGPQKPMPCANHFQDHKRLLVPRYKHALSRRLQVPAHTKKHAQWLDSWVRVSRRVERDQEKRCTWAGPSQAVLEMATSGAHARQASVNEFSGARLFSGFWVQSFPLRGSGGKRCRSPLQVVLHVAQFLDPAPSRALGLARRSRPSAWTPLSGRDIGSALTRSRIRPPLHHRRRCSRRESSSSCSHAACLVVQLPQGCLPPCQCTALSILRPSSARSEWWELSLRRALRVLWSLLFGFKLGFEPLHDGCAHLGFGLFALGEYSFMSSRVPAVRVTITRTGAGHHFRHCRSWEGRFLNCVCRGRSSVCNRGAGVTYACAYVIARAGVMYFVAGTGCMCSTITGGTSMTGAVSGVKRILQEETLRSRPPGAVAVPILSEVWVPWIVWALNCLLDDLGHLHFDCLMKCWTCVFATCCVSSRVWVTSISTIFSASKIAGGSMIGEPNLSMFHEFEHDVYNCKKKEKMKRKNWKKEKNGEVTRRN